MRCFFMNFKENLKRIMKERDIKNIDLANKIGISRSVITNYLQGTKEPRFETLEKIKNALACSYDDLLK